MQRNRRVSRRQLLSTAGALGLGTIAGCAGVLESGTDATTTTTLTERPLVEDRPDAVYYPKHVEGMQLTGIDTQGDLACALGYSTPHRFWLVTGRKREKVERAAADTMHLMPIVWDRETGIVLPDAAPQVTISKDGKQVTELSPWPMLSQPMGFHFGDNVQLPSEGTYTFEVTTGEPSTKRTGALADGEQESATFSFELTYNDFLMDDILVKETPIDKQGTKGAASPIDMKKLPSSQVPKPGSLPGTVRGTATSGDATFVVTTLSNASRFGGSGDETYLAVSPRTPHNRYMLPLMSLSATLSRSNSTVYDDVLLPTLDPELGYHYGAVVAGVESGDSLTTTVDAPPQTARHVGYETAFIEMPEMTVTL